MARISGADHLHLARVLRARPGEEILLLDGLGGAYRSVLVQIDKRESEARILGAASPPPEPIVYISVGQALGKSDKFEQVVQHGTEAGASSFIPLRAERCVVDIPANRIEDRLSRWRLIAKGAAEQAFRSQIPTVYAPMRIAEFLSSEPVAGEMRILLHTDREAASLRTALAQQPDRPAQIAVLVGPEGGWGQRDLADAAAAKCSIVSLGDRILRTETAALVAVSQILYHYE